MFATREPSFAALADAPVNFRWGNSRKRTLVDAFTASAIIAVHAAAGDEHKAKIERMVATPHGLARVAEFAFKVAGRR